MMKATIKKQEQKHFFIKSYKQLWQLEDAIQKIHKSTIAEVQLSVLGKLTEECISSTYVALKAKEELKRYWKGSLGQTSDFGVFCNPEIGTLFIVGALVSQFLHDMGGKVLGEMLSGPYGILRGMGVSENNASKYIKDLNKGYFLMMLRGYDYELDITEELLNRIE